MAKNPESNLVTFRSLPLGYALVQRCNSCGETINDPRAILVFPAVVTTNGDAIEEVGAPPVLVRKCTCGKVNAHELAPNDDTDTVN